MATDPVSISELAAALIERRRMLDSGEAEWLRWLAAFDRQGGWAFDGQTCAAAWLVQHCGMARSTANERLRVASELQRRPKIAGLFENGELSYSKVRAMTRIDHSNDDLDDALIQLARVGTAADLEHCVRHYDLLKEQDNPTDAIARWERRGLRATTRFDGMGTIEIVLPIEQQQRLLAVIDTWIRSRKPVDKASAEAPSTEGVESPVDKVSAEAPSTPMSWAQKSADAVCELFEGGLARLLDHRD